MTAISPFSLIEKLNPGKALGAAADAVVDYARDTVDPGGSDDPFRDTFSKLDANADGKLSGADALGHAMMLGNRVLEGVGNAMGFNMDGAPGETARNAHGPNEHASPVADTASQAQPPAQMLLAEQGNLATPSDTATRVLAALQGLDEIRATYAAMRAGRPV